MVLGVGRGVVTVAPLLLDPEDTGDETVALFEAYASDLAVPFGVSIASRFTLPLVVFDARLAQIGEGHSVLLDAASSAEHDSPSVTPVGRPLHGYLDPRIDRLGELTERFETLTAARWAVRDVHVATTDWIALADLGLVDTYRLYELANGAVPEPTEVAAASEHGLSIPMPGFDGALVDFLDRPRNSSRLRRRASRSRRSEESVRLEVATTLTNRQVALAARGGDGSFDWSLLFEEYLDETRA